MKTKTLRPETIGTSLYIPLRPEEREALKRIKREGRIIGVFVADAIREKLAREREAVHA